MRESEERFRSLVETTSDWIWEVDREGRYTYCSPKLTDILGYAPDELLGKTPFDLMPEEEAKRIEEIFRTITAEFKPIVNLKIRALHKDGRMRVIETSGVPIFDENHQYSGYRGIDRDVTDRSLAEEQIRNDLKEKGVMLQEIHHRVKNNLQIIISLLNLQSHHIKDPDTLNAFQESKNRVHSMAIVHENLYRSPDLTKIKFNDYIQTLSRELYQTYKVGAPVRLIFDLDEVLLSVDKAIPCGLILNELITNALKHAFVDQKEGNLRISCKKRQGENFQLIVEDDGVGISGEIRCMKTESLGMRLVHLLCDQISASIRFETSGGTRTIIELEND